jgi:hypothetical protein
MLARPEADAVRSALRGFSEETDLRKDRINCLIGARLGLPAYHVSNLLRALHDAGKVELVAHSTDTDPRCACYRIRA